MLFIDRGDLYPLGQRGPQLFDPVRDRSADLDDVPVCQRRHAESEGCCSVLADDLAWLFGLIASDTGDVVDRHLSDLSSHAKPQFFKPFGCYITRRNRQADTCRALGYLAIGEHLVLVREKTKYLVGRNPKSSEAGGWDRNGDQFFGEALNLDICDPVDSDESDSQRPRQITLLLWGQTFGRHSVEHAEDVAKVVVYDGCARARRKLPLHISDSASHFVPDLRDFVTTIGVHDVNSNLRHARHRLGFDPVQLLHLLQSILNDVSDFLLDLDGRGAGIGHEDERGLEGKARIFQTADRVQPPVATEQAEDDRKPYRDGTLDAGA